MTPRQEIPMGEDDRRETVVFIWNHLFCWFLNGPR